MKFSEDKKNTIILYLLEKIERGDDEISKAVAQNFDVNRNTIHTYINELVADGIIRRVKRGKYELATEKYSYNLKRSKGDLDSDTYAYEYCLKRYISDMPINIQHIWSYVFSEMVNNVMDHSGAENLKVEIEKDYIVTRVSIIDDGIGIFEKIKNYFGFKSVDEAICELFKGKLTTDSKNHSGEGIFFSSKMMDDFYIVSNGRIFTNNKYNDSEVSDMPVPNTKGTSVVMSLSNFSKKNPHEVFDLYADVDGGFTKTRIPIKNIFDTSPVSRSQAKRITNRLEEFEEVIVDFDGIIWIGQAFAHQLFVVFANEHPDVTLVPVNMNEDVTKMYNHVTL